MGVHDSIQEGRWRWPKGAAMTLFTMRMLVLAVALAPFASSQSRRSGVSEYEVKAAFLLNFARFVEWPADGERPGGPLSICVIGEDPFGSVLDQIVSGELANGRKLTVQRIPKPSNRCQLLFVSNSEPRIGAVLEATGPGVLTVGEGESFLNQGGMIAFVVEDRRVRFDVNLAAALAARLQISSRLLRVARTVKR